MWKQNLQRLWCQLKRTCVTFISFRQIMGFWAFLSHFVVVQSLYLSTIVRAGLYLSNRGSLSIAVSFASSFFLAFYLFLQYASFPLIPLPLSIKLLAKFFACAANTFIWQSIPKCQAKKLSKYLWNILLPYQYAVSLFWHQLSSAHYALLPAICTNWMPFLSLSQPSLSGWIWYRVVI